MKKLLLLSLLIIQQSFADDLIMSNIPNGCSSGFSTHRYFIATFSPKQYQCNAGYYLPANTDHCVVCPEYYDCNGGTFVFNEYTDQGNKYKEIIDEDITDGCNKVFVRSINNNTIIMATFIPNEHTCTTGYYLPANVDECTICPKNNKCVGGTYTFNETLTQGIEQCINSFAPMGSAVCYPHILHIDNNNVYLKSDKTTTPSLNVKINNDIFYANMTTIQTPMNKDTSQYLKINYNDTIYYACDDTVQ